MWVALLCTTMRDYKRNDDVSIRSTVAAVGLLGVVLVVAAHPITAGFASLAAAAIALSARTFWRQATGHGLSLPGTAGRLRIKTDAGRGDRDDRAMTVSITEK